MNRVVIEQMIPDRKLLPDIDLTRAVVETDEMGRVYDQTVLGWSRVLEMRNAEVEGHSQRVGALAVRLAIELDIPESEHRWIWRGAVLHDVGKMAIPDSVLLKPGPLNEAERRQIETHPLLARDMLEPIVYLRPCLPIPLCHHERWDGLGYPVGLSGDDIPIEARLFSVVDVFDALTSHRPYREAWSVRDAIAYIGEGAGNAFDPNVIVAFRALRLSDL